MCVFHCCYTAESDFCYTSDMKTTLIALRLDEPTAESVRARAQTLGMTTSAYLRELARRDAEEAARHALVARSNQIGLAYRERGSGGFFDEVGTPTAEIGGGTDFFDASKNVL